MNFQKAYCIKLPSLVDRLFLLLWGIFGAKRKKKKVLTYENLLFISF